jgi:hypothetical protein
MAKTGWRRKERVGRGGTVPEAVRLGRQKSDRNQTNGIVDNHAYSVIDCRNDVAGTDIDLIQVRNPWGRGEIENGMFVGNGRGWKKYPQIKKLLKPVNSDDGIFWLTKQEFFKHYETIYLSASNLTRFLKDGSKKR